MADRVSRHPLPNTRRPRVPCRAQLGVQPTASVRIELETRAPLISIGRVSCPPRQHCMEWHDDKFHITKKRNERALQERVKGPAVTIRGTMFAAARCRRVRRCDGALRAAWPPKIGRALGPARFLLPCHPCMTCCHHESTKGVRARCRRVVQVLHFVSRSGRSCRSPDAVGTTAVVRRPSGGKASQTTGKLTASPGLAFFLRFRQHLFSLPCRCAMAQRP